MRIDYINGHDEFDGELWFKDGKYVGHESQCDVMTFVPIGTSAVVEFHHRQIKPEFTYEDLESSLFWAKTIAEAEPFLVEETE